MTALAGRRGVVLALAALVAASLSLRAPGLGEPLWVDEGISIGIASHPLGDIPGLLRQDGSPPLYYALLHLWMRVFGDGERAVHALSLACALPAVPLAFWAGDRLFGRRAALAAAVLAATNPFLTVYSGEARMYALVMTLSVAAAGAAALVAVGGGRRPACVLGASLAALLWTHAWALFLLAGVGAALAVAAWRRPRDGIARPAAVALALALLAFAAWIPILVDQARHTGAPWSARPDARAILDGVWAPLDGGPGALVVLAAGGLGLAGLLRDGPARERGGAAALATMAGVALAAAWGVAQIEPNWANRYLSVLFGPVLLLAAAGLARLGRAGVAGLAVAAALPLLLPPGERKSTVDLVAARAAPALRPGDVVVSAQPEQVPVLAYYLPDGLRYRTPMGPVADPAVMDWRDVHARLAAAPAAASAAGALATIDGARRVLFVQPVPRGESWTRPWPAAVLRASAAWRRALDGHPRLRPVAAVPAGADARLAVRATLYAIDRAVR